MKKVTLTLAVVTGLFMGSCNSAKTEESAETTEMEAVVEENSVEVVMAAKSGSNLSGTVTFTESDNKVNMVVNVSGVEPGEHAIHIHEKPDCSADDGTSAGGHWNPAATEHGQWADGHSHHAGDIGNLTVDADGNGTMSFLPNLWCIGCSDSTKNILGHSVIIHAGVDDFVTQPTGNAGGRIGCGVIN